MVGNGAQQSKTLVVVYHVKLYMFEKYMLGHALFYLLFEMTKTKYSAQRLMEIQESPCLAQIEMLPSNIF